MNKLKEILNGLKKTNEKMIEGIETKSISGSRSLPLDDSTSWDGSAAEKRMRIRAGGEDKDKINWLEYGVGFVYVDPDKRKDFTGYKLPFADVKGGTLKAVWGGSSYCLCCCKGSKKGYDYI